MLITSPSSASTIHYHLDTLNRAVKSGGGGGGGRWGASFSHFPSPSASRLNFSSVLTSLQKTDFSNTLLVFHWGGGRGSTMCCPLLTVCYICSLHRKKRKKKIIPKIQSCSSMCCEPSLMTWFSSPQHHYPLPHDYVGSGCAVVH